MKKYYIIYTVIGLAFILCLLTTIFNPEAVRFLNPMTRRDVDLTGQVRSSTIGDIFLIILGAVFVIAVVGGYIFKLYKFIQKIIKKYKSYDAEVHRHRRTTDEISANTILRHQDYPDRDENKYE